MLKATSFSRRLFNGIRFDCEVINLDKLLVKGGNRLKGTVCISGAKNAAQPILAASLLTKEKVTLHNVPELGDVSSMIGMLHGIGADVSFKDNIAEIIADKLNAGNLLYCESATKIRGSTHVLAALLHRFNEVEIPLPGGCNLGTRGLDLHFEGLRKLGARVNLRGSKIAVELDELHGCNIPLYFPSVSATENIMIAACFANGKSVIENAAKEPEIADLANFLNSMGADINGAGTETIEVKGVGELSGTEYTIMPDRIETGTYLVAAAICAGDIIVKNANLAFLDNVVSTLRKIGATITVTPDGVRATAKDNLCATDVITEVYPGFPTDMQPAITSLLTVAEGQSTVKETIFDNRFNHVPELLKMKADIKIKGNTLLINGKEKLFGAVVDAHDIRGGASLILAALIADGTTTIENTQQIIRGYEKPLEKLQGIGAECYLLPQ